MKRIIATLTLTALTVLSLATIVLAGGEGGGL